MRSIRIERYPNPEALGVSGLIEGERDDGSTWIMWLDDKGDPTAYWANRDEGGGIMGAGVDLRRKPPRKPRKPRKSG